MANKTRFVLTAAAAVAVDVVTKIAAVNALGSRTFDAGLIDLRIVRNDGVAFGAGSFIPPVLLVLLTLVMTVVLVVAVWRGGLPAGAFTGLIVGGALANVMDRIVGGTVVDIFDLGWWPAFNIADVCIVLGVAGLLMQGLRPTGSLLQESA